MVNWGLESCYLEFLFFNFVLIVRELKNEQVFLHIILNGKHFICANR